MFRLTLVVVVLAACKAQPATPPAPPPPASKPARTAAVISVVGEAKQRGVLLVAGQTLALDEEIVVGEGRVELMLSWAGTVRVLPRTQLVVGDLATERPRADVRISVGRVWALIDRLVGGSFEIEATNAVAGVRGTELYVEASADKSEVYVVEGEVEVASKKTPSVKRSVKAKQRTFVIAEAVPTEPVEAPSRAHEDAWVSADPASMPSVQPPVPDVPKKTPKLQPKKEVKLDPVVAPPPPAPPAPTGANKKFIDWNAKPPPPPQQPPATEWPKKKP